MAELGLCFGRHDLYMKGPLIQFDEETYQKAPQK
jgi:hypothetical protein